MIVIVEGTNTYTVDMSYAELQSAIEYAKKERERHRMKSKRSYYARKAKKEETPSEPPASPASSE